MEHADTNNIITHASVYFDGPRKSRVQQFTDAFYRDFATEANRLYGAGQYSLETLRQWSSDAVGLELGMEFARSAVVLCRGRGWIDKPGYAKRKAKPKPKATKPAAAKPQKVSTGMTTDEMMALIIKGIYTDGKSIPQHHIDTLLKFRGNVENLLGALR